MTVKKPIENRYDFVLYFDVENGNPNGDPDAGNMPRVDPVTNHGIVTDVCLKRKVRDYVDVAREGEAGYDLYIRSGEPLVPKCASVLGELGYDVSAVADLKKTDPGADLAIRDAMCAAYYDVRTFGAVISTLTKGALNSGQVRGPVQLTFARSVDPIVPQEVTLTRVAITTEEDNLKKRTEMGRKFVVPYALYRAEGFVSANLARKTTGFSDEDLQLLWEALANMFEHDRTAARGKMAVRALVAFKHDSELGCAPAHKLFELVGTRKRDGVVTPRAFSDYEPIEVDESAVPAGVEVLRLV